MIKISWTAAVVILAVLATTSGAQVTVTTFEGIDAYSGATAEVAPNGAVGTKQFMESASTVYQAYDKATGVPIYPSPVPADTPWANMPDCQGPSTDVEILFDRLASRWVIGRPQGVVTYFYCVAVSNTDDVTAPNFSWYPYELLLNPILGLDPSGKHTYYPDSPKIGTWSDGYYVAMDLEDPDDGYQEAGIVACAFDRADMLQGLTMLTPQCFEVKGQEPYLAHSLEPADIDGLNAPPAGQPEYFVSMENPAKGQTTARVLMGWAFHVDWANPVNSTFRGSPFGVKPYTQGCFQPTNPTNTFCVPEPSSAQTGIYLDSVGDRLMPRFSYRRFLGANPYQSWLVSHAIQVGSTVGSQTGIRWYEYRDVGKGNFGDVTFDDGNYRWVPSIAEDQTGHMSVGYSLSGTEMHPSMAASYLDLNKPGPPTELLLLRGAADEENSGEWGPYSSMTVDPVDNCTFWYVNEYFSENQMGGELNWQTRIAHFALPTCP